ncbi:beta-ketoacyl synthase N-terminal-like domain-containing protein [Burkholderia gladioli]|uniref:beta-ketoacyl synthase N-terminal-like domain-containing protein n=1 Tax=Burkholderia gladioli TaxID=28095 RepID=UPI001ABB5203|nr:beta-ketoacyl synthase N-terminal-like domain-containing protein [Burkholderia gladioli]
MAALDAYLEGAEGAALAGKGVYVGEVADEGMEEAGSAALSKASALSGQARDWCEGLRTDDAVLHRGGRPRRLAGLPTYPFARRPLGQPPAAEASPAWTGGTGGPGGPGDKAAEYYTFDAQRRSDTYHEEYLTFCPFEREQPGFSMTRVLSAPEAYPDEYRQVLDKQKEMRAVTFRHERFERVGRVLDIGCGCGSDLIELALRHPALHADGFTITPAQAELGNRRIANLGIAERVRIRHADSSRDAFPHRYDLVIGFEVSCHIADKTALFSNIRRSLAPTGSILLMDFIANLRGSIVDDKVDIAISPQAEWANVLAEQGLVIDDLVDLSEGIANYVFDPDVERNIAHFPEAARRSSRNFANMAVSLRQNWISYCLFRIVVDRHGRSTEALRAANAAVIARRTPYREALADLFARRDGSGDIGLTAAVMAAASRQAPAREAAKEAVQQAAPAPQPAAAPSAGARAATVREALERVMIDTLGVSPAELRAAHSFAELGVDSLLAVRLLEAINVAFDLHEPTSVMFEFHDTQALAAHLETRGARVAALPAEAAVALAGVPAARADSRPAGPALEPGAGHEGLPGPSPEALLPGTQPARDGIAVVGMACRCAGAQDPAAFWRLVARGEIHLDSVAARRPAWGEYLAAHEIDAQSLRAGFADDIDAFDPLFFDISPVQAEQMDASQRVLLEGIHAAIEDAGYDPASLAAREVGTFIGSMGVAGADSLSHHAMLGNDGAILSSRIAYHLNLSGPAMTVNTACSSALVAISLACDKLRAGELDMAIAGGITLYTQPASFVMMRNAGMLSPSGACRPFDDGADGIVVGDGMGVVVLMPAERARAEGAHVYGVIRAIGTNQDGRTSGITAPSFLAQSRLETQVYRAARLSPEALQYVEAHGTGTRLGDPVELHALTEAFRGFTARRSFCAIGSVKANIGHATAAAGALGLIKVLLAMRHATLPPVSGFAQPNRHVDFAASPFRVETQARPWLPGEDGMRRAALSAFGFSGTNAHLVVEAEAVPEAGEAIEAVLPGGLEIVPLSARQPAQLEAVARRLLAFLEGEGARSALGDLAWTLQVGRTAHEYRVAFTVPDLAALKGALSAWLASGAAERLVPVRGEARPPIEAHAGLDAAARATAWSAGGLADWSAWRARPARRIPLPTYPFARQRFGRPTPPPTSGQAGPGAARATAAAAGRRAALAAKQWHAAPLAAGRRVEGRVEILATPALADFAASLARELPDARIWLDHELAAAPAHAEHWRGSRGCLDLSALDPASSTGHHAAWFGWLQRLVEHADATLEAPLVVQQWTAGLAGHPRPSLAGAARSGLYRMLQSEYRRVVSRHVDTDLDAGADRAALIAQIVAEFAADDGMPEVRYRGGVRERAVLDWIEPPARQPEGKSVEPGWPADGVLWITGGTRGIGMRLAHHFATRHGVRGFVLAGERPLPPRASWPALAADAEDPLLRRKLSDLLALEALGAQVRVTSAPLTDLAAWRAAVAALSAELGEPFGLIHCAGRVDFEAPAFVRKTAESVAAVSAPKVAGVETLRAAFADRPLRFVLLCSSISAALPAIAVGQAEYAAANAYLDHVAEAGFGPRAARCVSIQWPSWRDTGMGAASGAAHRDGGLLACSDEEGLAFLDAVLAGATGPVVTPLVVDPSRFAFAALGGVRAARASSEPARLAQAAAGGDAGVAVDKSAEAGRAAPADPGAAASAWLARIVGDELKIAHDALDVERRFDDYGVDSIMLAQMVKRIDAGLPGTHLDPSALLEHPSVARLAAYLLGSCREAVMLAVSGGRRDAAASEAVVAPGPVEPAEPAGSADTPREAGPAPARDPRAGGGARERIAVVGMACHFPAAQDIDAFWRNLRDGRDCIGEVPASRWSVARHYGGPDYADGKSVTHQGGFLDDIESFDPGYFGIPEAVAPGVDPLARQWLEVSAEALADAGYTRQDVWGRRVGVFCGSRTSNYSSRLAQLDSKAVIGVGQNFISAHLSHCYHLGGPNVVVDTACASALTAIHLAAQSLRSGESSLAIAGGVDILLDEGPFLLLSSARILSAGGRCRTFDEGADGIGIGEGCGVLILKRLSDAVREGNKIYGVIDGSAVNADGSTMGITTPNPERQRELIELAIADAAVDAASISYVEAHGTGTLIGDPIELRSLTAVLAPHHRAARACGVGSVKSNLGHLLSAAGAAGMVKVLLSLAHRALPPTLHCDTPNPRFDFEASPLYPVRELQAWAGVDGVLRAGISAFGLGGHNAHLIVSDEGVPDALRADTVPRAGPVRYARRRYWIGEARSDALAPAAPLEREPLPAEAMGAYFAIRRTDADDTVAAH